jgi:hypothetical protein
MRFPEKRDWQKSCTYYIREYTSNYADQGWCCNQQHFYHQIIGMTSLKKPDRLYPNQENAKAQHQLSIRVFELICEQVKNWAEDSHIAAHKSGNLPGAE